MCKSNTFLIQQFHENAEAFYYYYVPAARHVYYFIRLSPDDHCILAKKKILYNYLHKMSFVALM